MRVRSVALGGVRADHRHGFLPRVGGSESPDLSWAMPVASQVFLVSSFPGTQRRSKNDQFTFPRANQLWGFDGLWTVRILFRQSAKDEAFQDFSCHSWIPLPVFEFERTFIQKMFVKLCAWFGPDHAKTIFKHFELFFSNERSRGLGVFLAGKTRFFHVSLQIAPRQGFRNIQPNQYKEKQQMGLMR